MAGPDVDIDNARRMVEEYEWMRSFNMGAERACAAIVRAPASVIRYYRILGLTAPHELRTAESMKKTDAMKRAS